MKSNLANATLLRRRPTPWDVCLAQLNKYKLSSLSRFCSGKSFVSLIAVSVVCFAALCSLASLARLSCGVVSGTVHLTFFVLIVRVACIAWSLTIIVVRLYCRALGVEMTLLMFDRDRLTWAFCGSRKIEV